MTPKMNKRVYKYHTHAETDPQHFLPFYQSAKAGRLLPPHPFLVKDPEQEMKFSFSLQESLRTASSQPLLQVLEVTRLIYFRV